MAACSWGPGRIDLFRVADDGTLRHRTETAARWSAEEDLGGTCASAPAIVTWAPDAMEVFAIFPGGALWDRYWDGPAGTRGSRSAGRATRRSSPAAAAHPPGRPSSPHQMPRGDAG
ncbi:MAG TPA: hypothetical protein VFC97_07740 [Verrucomicrobiae bacterium]|nr:hypothetical protein [Verrucomicrobiae bacterium]